MALHNHNLNDAIEGGVIGAILSIAMTTIREQIWGELVHGVSTVFWACVAAIVVFYLNKYLRKRDNDTKIQ